MGREIYWNLERRGVDTSSLSLTLMLTPLHLPSGFPSSEYVISDVIIAYIEHPQPPKIVQNTVTIVYT